MLQCFDSPWQTNTCPLQLAVWLSEEDLTQSITDDMGGHCCIWLQLNPCFAVSFRLGAIGPTAQASRVHMNTKPTCGAWKTPHKGQLQDSPAQETMDQDRVDWICSAGRGRKKHYKGLRH